LLQRSPLPDWGARIAELQQYKSQLHALRGRRYSDKDISQVSNGERKSPDSALSDAESAKAADQAAEPARLEEYCAQIGPRRYTELLNIKKKIDPTDKYLGNSVAILRVFEQIHLFNRVPDAPVLILGPTGAGKTEIANLIHESSGRSARPFHREQAATSKHADMGIVLSRWAGVGQNSGLPDTKRSEGILHTCDGGTVFIDEVADIREDLQTFLLDVIDRNSIPPAAVAREPVTPDVRLLFATNNDLPRLADDGHFRHDLFDRIKRRTIEIPSLDQRKEDIVDFVHANAGERRVTLGFLWALIRHSWQGNVRELLDVIDSAIARCIHKDQPLTPDLLGIPSAASVVELDKAKLDKEIYGFLRGCLENRGFEVGKGLHEEMARLLRCSAPTVTRMAKSYRSAQ
jgi:psp operon transcriptional activator